MLRTRIGHMIERPCFHRFRRLSMPETLEVRAVPGGSLLELFLGLPMLSPVLDAVQDRGSGWSTAPQPEERATVRSDFGETRQLLQITPEQQTALAAEARTSAEGIPEISAFAADSLAAQSLTGALDWLDALPSLHFASTGQPAVPQPAVGDANFAAPAASTQSTHSATPVQVEADPHVASAARAYHGGSSVSTHAPAAAPAASAAKATPTAKGGAVLLDYPPMPPTANNDSYSTRHDVTLSVSASGVLSNDTLPPGTTVSLVSNPYHASSFTFNTNGSFSYTPSYHYVGADSFIYRLTNGTYSDDATVSINVWNAPPTAQNDSYSTRHDIQLTVSVPGVKSNDTSTDGDPITAILVSTPAHAAAGGFQFNANGSFSYTPAYHYVGTDSFTYKVNDGLIDSSTATVSINVWNAPPTAQNDSYSVKHDTLLAVSAPGVKSNDTSTDGDAITAVLVTSPSHAQSFTFNADGSFTYMPAYHYYGSDSFTYKVNDGIADSNTATVSLNVMNQTPVLDQLSGEGPGLTIDQDIRAHHQITWLGEEIGRVHAVDYDGDPVTYQLDSSSLISINATTGIVTIVNPADFDAMLLSGGSFNINVRATDGLCYTDPKEIVGAVRDYIPSRYIDLTTASGRHEYPTSGNELRTILSQMQGAGDHITTLIIKGHGWNTMIKTGDGPVDELTCFGGQIRINDVDVTATMQAVTGPGSQIKLRGCHTRPLADDVEDTLNNGTAVYGALGFVINIPGTRFAMGIYD